MKNPTNLSGEFSKDEKILMDYTIQKINYKKKIYKIQVAVLISLVLIVSLFGFYFFKYSLDEKELKDEYGINYYCYKCGYISGKTCSCNYVPEIIYSNPANRENYFLSLGVNNAKSCNFNESSEDIDF